jgi:hypothetical protein
MGGHRRIRLYDFFFIKIDFFSFLSPKNGVADIYLCSHIWRFLLHIAEFGYDHPWYFIDLGNLSVII